jgi:hypothetical protein
VRHHREARAAAARGAHHAQAAVADSRHALPRSLIKFFKATLLVRRRRCARRLPQFLARRAKPD